MALKIDSNITGLRFAEESTLGTLPGSPVWYPLEPNSYNDFGGKLSTVARNPINPSRQRKKGTITDLDASGGFNQDLTQNNTTRLMQGLFFADARERATTQSVKTTAGITITGVTGTTVTAASGLDAFPATGLVRLSGFGTASNNGLKVLTASAAGALTITGLTAEAAPPATAKVEYVGMSFATANMTTVGGLPRFDDGAGTVDFSTLLIPGEWVFLGGDGANSFTTSKGFARVSAVTATYVEFDKIDWVKTDETGSNVYMFFGTIIRNEPLAADVKRRTYHLERSLGNDDDGTMYEYLVGACANEMTVNMKQADKVTVDLSFVATDNEQRTGAQGVKVAGTRPSLVNTDCFNTSSDFSRIKLSVVDPTSATPTPMFAYATDLTITLKNNVKPLKALGKLGAFDTSAGTFEIGGSLTAYFANIAAVQAVRNNSDVTLDIAIVKANSGVVFDIPLMSLGGGQLDIKQDEPITVPLEMNAAQSKFDTTFEVVFFPYLPTIADK